MKGQAFVGLPNETVALRAVKEINGFVLHGKPMVVVSGLLINLNMLEQHLPNTRFSVPCFMHACVGVSSRLLQAPPPKLWEELRSCVVSSIICFTRAADQGSSTHFQVDSPLPHAEEVGKILRVCMFANYHGALMVEVQPLFTASSYNMMKLKTKAVPN